MLGYSMLATTAPASGPANGLPHSNGGRDAHTLHELATLFEFLGVGSGIVSLDHDHTQDGCLLREGGARRGTDEQENCNGHGGISSHWMFSSLDFSKVC